MPILPATDHQPKPHSGPPAEEVLRLRKEFLTPALFHLYKQPLMIVEGRGQYVWDERGKRYLDGFAGIATVSVGHCHPHVLEAARRQNETLQHASTIYLHPNIAEFGRALAAKMPGELKVCYFVNSGSEANDLAIIDHEQLQQNALTVGSHLLAGLQKLQAKHELIGDVRGSGLMIGMELVRDRASKEPARQECLEVLERARELGLLIGKGGLHGQTLRIKPPLCITRADADFLLKVLDAVIP
jgi:4-aminobutyrate aminotransferase-like enzyme